jgi:hypothetical protein
MERVRAGGLGRGFMTMRIERVENRESGDRYARDRSEGREGREVSSYRESREEREQPGERQEQRALPHRACLPIIRPKHVHCCNLIEHFARLNLLTPRPSYDSVQFNLSMFKYIP